MEIIFFQSKVSFGTWKDEIVLSGEIALVNKHKGKNSIWISPRTHFNGHYSSERSSWSGCWPWECSAAWLWGHKAIFYSNGYFICTGEKLNLRGKINEQSLCSDHLWLIEVISYRSAERNEKTHLFVNFELWTTQLANLDNFPVFHLVSFMKVWHHLPCLYSVHKQ